MNSLHILIADDESPARQKLRNFLSGENNIEKISEAVDGEAAIEQIIEDRPDLILLDIQMPKITGFQVIEKIGVENMPPVVFVTAYDEYALKAFSVHAIDYLLKPFDRERFQASFHRAVEQIKLKSSQVSLFEKLLQEVGLKKEYLNRIMVKVGERFSPIPVEEILYFQADGKYVQIYTFEKKHLHRETLSEFETQLDPTQFARIHRSHIVNLNAIRELSPRSHGDYWVELKNGEKLVMSRRYRERVFR